MFGFFSHHSPPHASPQVFTQKANYLGERYVAVTLQTPGIDRCSSWAAFGESGKECADTSSTFGITGHSRSLSEVTRPNPDQSRLQSPSGRTCSKSADFQAARNAIPNAKLGRSHSSLVNSTPTNGDQSRNAGIAKKSHPYCWLLITTKASRTVDIETNPLSIT